MTTEAMLLMRELEELEARRKKVRKKLVSVLSDAGKSGNEDEDIDEDEDDTDDPPVEKKRKKKSVFSKKPFPRVPDRSDKTQRYRVPKKTMRWLKEQPKVMGDFGVLPFGAVGGVIGEIGGLVLKVGATSDKELRHIHRVWLVEGYGRGKKYQGKYPQFRDLLAALTRDSRRNKLRERLPPILESCSRSEAKELIAKKQS